MYGGNRPEEAEISIKNEDEISDTEQPVRVSTVSVWGISNKSSVIHETGKNSKKESVVMLWNDESLNVALLASKNVLR